MLVSYGIVCCVELWRLNVSVVSCKDSSELSLTLYSSILRMNIVKCSEIILQ